MARQLQRPILLQSLQELAGTARFAPDGGGARHRLVLERLQTGQELMEHQAELVHIRRLGDRLATHLFGAGIAPGERVRSEPGEVGPFGLRVEQLGDAEVQ